MVETAPPSQARRLVMVEPMVPTSSREQTVVRVLFWGQMALAVVSAFAGVALLWVTAGVAGWTPFAALVLGMGVVGLVVLERRKRLAVSTQSPAAWARSVRDLRSSRLEIVEAFEIERRRIERDLHDGSQQHIVSSSLKVGEAELVLAGEGDESGTHRLVIDLLHSAQSASEAALAALRATVAGIHPTVLVDLGLEAAVRDVATRSPLEVTVRVPHPLPRIPQGVAAAAYFLISEALTNVAKHAPDAGVSVLLSAGDELHVSVVDDGPGGAHVTPGHGLAGMAERLAAFGGELRVASPAGGPTSLIAHAPLLLSDGESGIAAERVVAPR